MNSTPTLTARDGLELAIKAVGYPSRLAQRISIAPQAISKWRRAGKVPLLRVPDVARVSGVPAHLIRPDRPDFFPPPHQQQLVRQQQEA